MSKIDLQHADTLDVAACELTDYAWRNLASHLFAAGQHSELASLLQFFPWLYGKLVNTSVTDLLGDLQLLPNQEVVAQLRDCIDRSAYVLVNRPNELATQMVGRLIDSNCSGTQEFRDHVHESIRGPWLIPTFPFFTSAEAPLMAVLAEHEHGIETCAVTSDSLYAVTGGNDGTVRVWSLETRSQYRQLCAYKSEITAVAISDDGSLVVSGSSGKKLRVWDVESGRGLGVLKMPKGGTLAVAISANRRAIAACTANGRVCIWEDVDRPQRKPRQFNIGKGLQSIAFVDQSSKMLLVTRQVKREGRNGIAFWRIDLTQQTQSEDAVVFGENVDEWSRTINNDFASTISRNGRFAAVALREDEADLISLIDGSTRISKLRFRSMGYATSLCVSDDGKQVLYATTPSTVRQRQQLGPAKENTIHVLRSEGDPHAGSLYGHSQRITHLASSFDGSVIMSASHDSTARIWRGSAANSLDEREHGERCEAIAVSANGRFALKGVFEFQMDENPVDDDGDGYALKLELIDLRHDKLVNRWFGEARGYHWSHPHDLSLAVSDDGKLAVTDWDRRFGPSFWNCCDGSLAWRTMDSQDRRTRTLLAFSPNHSLVAVAWNNELQVWDFKTRLRKHSLPGHNKDLTAISVSADGTILVSASAGKKVRVWNISHGFRMDTLKGIGDVYAVSVSSGGRFVAAVSHGAVCLWDRKTPTGPAQYPFDQSITAIAIDEHGEVFAACVSDRTLEIHSVSRKMCVGTVTIEHSVTACTATGDAQRFIFGDQFGKVCSVKLVGNQ